MKDQLIKKAIELGYDNPMMFNIINDEGYSYWLYGLQKWLREKYKIYVEVEITTNISNEIAIWLVSVYKKSELIIGISKEHLTYEEALEEGLYEALKLI